MALPSGLNSGIFGGQLVNTKPDPNFIPTYTGNSKYGSIMNDYYQSEMFDRDAYFNVSPIQPTISLMNPLFGSMGPGQMGQMGNFNEFLKSNYEQMLNNMPSKVARSQEYMDKFNLYGDAYDKMGFGNPQPTLGPGTSALNPIPQDPGTIQELLGSGGNPMQPITGDTSEQPAGPSIMDPGGSGTAEIENLIQPATPITGNLFELQNPSQVIGGGFDPSTVSATPGVNPIAPMPTMPTAPNMQPGHSHDDLLSGIGNLFQQYFPQQNTQQINQSAPQPSFDAFGNNTTQQPASNQVFGNMITPNFGGGY